MFEKSPYLLQHAGNPVDWHPWGVEAFEKARKEDKPVFLSIGYATCHWCHVMERESFEDEEVGRILNNRFVAIKVDREERPDVDQIYMAVCQAMTGSGGWPLTLVLTPDRKPFFAGTYFPKEGRWGRPGLTGILTRLADAWGRERQDVLASAEQAAQFLKDQVGRVQAGKAPGLEALEAGYRQLRQRYDGVNGGFGGAPKFLVPHDYAFVLRHWKRTRDPEALRMVEHSLAKMARGGIHDHLGGGFHRYSTDAVWRVPHFEKMLYDQALLAMACTEAYQATGKAEYAETARDILRYVLRDMTSPEGGFYSAEDADSEGLEGKFYVWRPEEIVQVLGKERGDRFNRFYGVTESGNFHEPHGPKGHSILNIALPIDAFAGKEGMAPEALSRELAEGRERLFAVRETRIHPIKDDKILVDWNGLMIAALARGAQALEEPAYAEAARKAADFLLATLQDKKGRLLHRYRQGDAAIPAHLDDYAFLALGLTDLYEATLDPRYLEAAVRLTGEMTARFWDDQAGGLFFTASDAEALLVRNKETYDGAVPSGNSVAALVYLRLARMTGRPEWEDRANKVMAVFSDALAHAPSSHAQLLVALDFAVGPSKEIVIAGKRDDPLTREMLSAVRRGFLPNKVLLFHPAEAGEARRRIESICGFIRDQEPIQGRTAAYICEGFVCKAPTDDVKKMLSALGEGR